MAGEQRVGAYLRVALGWGRGGGSLQLPQKKSSNILHLLVKKVICGGKNLSGKSESDDVLTHA